MVSEKVKVVFDSDEHMYPLEGESEEQFEARMEKLRIERNKRMTDKEKQQVKDLLKKAGIED